MQPEPPSDAPPSDAPAFEQPWQAELHALTVALHEAGLFAWDEWSAALGRAMRDAAPDGSDAYHRWADALAGLLEDRGIATVEAIERLARSWQRAAEATPHGAPIALENDPLRASVLPSE